jgi:CDP-diacylglycerol--glycerol-3-phosphate 3-phosphatidyltransferase
MASDLQTPSPPADPERDVTPGRTRPRPGSNRLEVLRDRLIASRLTPNQISMAGFTLNVIAAVLVWQHEFFIGGVVFIVGSVCDTLDGGYSRMSGKGTPFGAFLDSTLDRIVEGIVLTAVAATFAEQEDQLAVAAVVVAVMASLVVSYTRARAEALGVECKVGIADRLVRVVIISAGLVFADLGALEPAVYVLAALTSVTVLQRILHVKKQLTPAPTL